MDSKICSTCGEEKPISRFRFYKGSYRKSCVDCANTARRKRRANDPEHRERLNSRKRNLYANDPEYRNRVLLSCSISGQKLKKEMIDRYGGVCKCCGESQIDFLHIHHPDNDGGKHRRECGGQSGSWYEIKRNGFTRELEVMCSNCNHAIQIYGICPHKLTGLEDAA